MAKYTTKQIAESDELFIKEINKVRKFYLSRNPDKMEMLDNRIKFISDRNRDLEPCYNEDHYCATCGSKDGKEHFHTGYCFYCDTDNWINKNTLKLG